MNPFLNRVLAPGLRRVGSGLAYPRKAAPPIVAPSNMESTLEESVEGEPAGPGASPPFWEDAEGRERFEVGSIEERASLPPSPSSPLSDKPDETHAGERAAAPEPLPPPRDMEKGPFLEEMAPIRPAPFALPPITEERPKPIMESLSFEPVEFNRAVHPSQRRFQPTGEKRSAGEGSVQPEQGRAEQGRGLDRPAREIVWEVVPADRKRSAPKEKVHQAFLSGNQPSKARPSDPVHPSPAERTEKDERTVELSPKAPSIPPRGATLPRLAARAKEEKGDLIIEQLEVRVVAEPERKPEPPRARPEAPKRSGAWETAARYYLGKV
ncbi:MAG: hypothetical protein MPW16_10500 [Candidatus Manganitrophus sp.]|nr:MAG: hypothetical protein MPW16_10500 [Candidatus Manganitrophus sp.]